MPNHAPPPHTEHLPAAADRHFGVHTARVTDVKDPEGLGRVKILLDAHAGVGARQAWARLSTLMGGNNRGSWFIPDLNDEVVVAFAGGDPSQPFVLGGLWNTGDRPPEIMDGGGGNFLKVLRSRNGVKVTLDDHDGAERVVIETPAGQRLTLQDGPGSVRLEDSSGNSVTLDGSGVAISATGKVSVRASEVELEAGTVRINAGTTRIAGILQCDELVANSVVASSYSPGAGNVW